LSLKQTKIVWSHMPLSRKLVVKFAMPSSTNDVIAE